MEDDLSSVLVEDSKFCFRPYYKLNVMFGADCFY